MWTNQDSFQRYRRELNLPHYAFGRKVIYKLRELEEFMNFRRHLLSVIGSPEYPEPMSSVVHLLTVGRGFLFKRERKHKNVPL
jgi:hypothetical protein